MYFDTLILRNFGPFKSFDVSFSSSGINLVTGPNGAGKTQLLGAIIFSLVGGDAVDFRPDGRMPSEVALTIREGDSSEVVSCSLNVQEPTIDDPRVLVNREVESSSKTRQPEEWTDHLLGLLGSSEPPSLLLDLQNMDAQITRRQLDVISDIEWRDEAAARAWSRLRAAHATSGDDFQQRASLGELRLLRVARELVARKNVSRPIPLLVDTPFSLFDRGDASAFVNEVLSEIGKRDQVIIVSAPDNVPEGIRQSARVHRKLGSPTRDFLASLSYNYYPRSLTSKATARSRFVLGQPMVVEENRYYEFKEVKGGNPIRAITSVVDEYAVAYLNLGTQGIGRIYWGVRDEDREVVGVKLTLRERDEIRRVVTDKLHKIEPRVAPSTYKVTLEPVYKAGKALSDVFVVEVEIPSSPSNLLYATGSGEVYVKTDSGKKRLSPLEIQREVLIRHNSGASKDT